MIHNLAVMAPPNEQPRWLEALGSAFDDSWRVEPVEQFDPTLVEVMAVAPPLRRSLNIYPNLKLIQSLWAGVEVILKDPALRTDVPLARMKDPEMERSMGLSVLAHVLAYNQHHDEYRRQQTDSKWQQIYGVPANERKVVFLGFGAMGRAGAEAVANAGFRVAAMTRTPRTHPTIKLFDRADLKSELDDAHILVNVLPVTPETVDLIDGDFLAMLPVGAAVINVARGAHIVDDDLLDALDSGRLRHAFLDAYRVEPLPVDHRFWQHPRVTVIPHMAAPTFPSSGGRFVAEQVSRLERNEPLENLVDHERGY